MCYIVCFTYIIAETYIDLYTRFIAFVLTVVCFPALIATRSLPGCDGAAEKFRGGQSIQIRPGIVWFKSNILRVLFFGGHLIQEIS